MSTDQKPRPRSWVNIAELRERVKNVSEMMAREEGLGDVRVYVEVKEAKADKPRVVRVVVEELPHVDGTDQRWEEFRGRSWEDN